MAPRRGQSLGEAKEGMYTDLSHWRLDLRSKKSALCEQREKMSHFCRTSQLLRVRGRRRRRCLRLSGDLSACLSVASKAVAVWCRLRHENASICDLALSVLDTLVHVVWILRDHWSVGNMAFVASRRRDEDVEPAGNHEASEESEEYDVADTEAHDMQRVGLTGKRCAGVDEVGVGEGVHDGEDWAGDVLHQRAPEDWNVPVLAGADDDVQILAKLFTLGCVRLRIICQL
jgi:hypothetical protein